MDNQNGMNLKREMMSEEDFESKLKNQEELFSQFRDEMFRMLSECKYILENVKKIQKDLKHPTYEKGFNKHKGCMDWCSID